MISEGGVMTHETLVGVKAIAKEQMKQCDRLLILPADSPNESSTHPKAWFQTFHV